MFSWLLYSRKCLSTHLVLFQTLLLQTLQLLLLLLIAGVDQGSTLIEHMLIKNFTRFKHRLCFFLLLLQHARAICQYEHLRESLAKRLLVAFHVNALRPRVRCCV